MNYDEQGALVLSGKLGKAAASGSLSEFYKALADGVTPDFEDPLTYQDMTDFDAFRSTFLYVGQVSGTILLRRGDGATFARLEGEPFEDLAVFKPAEVTVNILGEE